MTIGERLKQARDLRGYSQQKLADAIGTSRTVITNIEYNKTSKPQSSFLDSICRTLQINIAWLKDGKGPMEQPQPDWSVNELMYKIHEELSHLDKNQLSYICEFIAQYDAHHSPSKDEK
ncbi:MAG: helix-turn-helix transcriptional regulator [Eubacterium sp.]|nr:helix-turn-helix transcriptional regulator [Eubacterium sp.]